MGVRVVMTDAYNPALATKQLQQASFRTKNRHDFILKEKPHWL